MHSMCAGRNTSETTTTYLHIYHAYTEAYFATYNEQRKREKNI